MASIELIKKFLDVAPNLSLGSTVDLEADRINEDERQAVLKAIEKLVSHSDIGYWGIFLED